ncbi:toprim domain-containing protein [Ruegeria atlantica]|uniref:toprim domain-containing protein n=1 Tax=Ruegeria atlantica TaxID=81569 RepID=UPI00249566F1|nr:toprim domain-containing protein [Ruegeria atlantica]
MRFTNLSEDERERLTSRAVEVCIAILGPPNQKYSGNPRWGRKGSMVLLPHGLLHDHSEGETLSMVDLVVRHVGGDFGAAKDWIRGFIGDEPSQSDIAPVVPFTPPTEVWPAVARQMWESSARGPAVGHYLRGRGITLDARYAALRANTKAKAIVALYELPDGSPSTVQKIYPHLPGVKPFVKGGQHKGSACRVGRIVRKNADRLCVVGEGIENALAFAQLHPAELSGADVTIWAAGHSGNLPNWNHGKPDRLLIAADNDKPGIRAAEMLKEKYPQAEIIKPDHEGEDWNDALMGETV